MWIVLAVALFLILLIAFDRYAVWWDRIRQAAKEDSIPGSLRSKLQSEAIEAEFKETE